MGVVVEMGVQVAVAPMVVIRDLSGSGILEKGAEGPDEVKTTVRKQEARPG